MRTHPSNRHTLVHGAALPALASNRLLGFFAASMVGVFLPIFLFEFFGGSIQYVLLWFIIDFVFKFPFFVWGAKIFSRTGLVPSMVIGTLGTVLFYWMFYLLDTGGVFPAYFLLAFGTIGLMLVSAFYWSPYHIDLASATHTGSRGKQISIFYALERLLGVLSPLLAGWIIMTYGYSLNFFLGLVITLTSLVPLFFLPRFRVTYEFGFLESFQKLFSRPFRGMSYSMMAYGAENIVGVVIWPLFLFTLFQGNYFDVGAFAAIVVVIGMVLEIVMGHETDQGSLKKLLKIGTGVYALGWIWKGLVDTLLGVFAASTFHSLGSTMMRTPMDTMMYTQAADSGHYIDEYTVLHEIALNAGRVSMLIILFFFTSIFSLSASFFLAALISLGINWLNDYRVSPK